MIIFIFSVQICSCSIIVKTDIKILRCNSDVNLRFGKKYLSSSINFSNCGSPCIQIKKIVSLSKSFKWLKFLLFKKVCLSFIHMNASVRRRELQPNNSAMDLLFNFFTKFEKIVFENKFCYVSQIIGMCLSGILFF